MKNGSNKVNWEDIEEDEDRMEVKTVEVKDVRERPVLDKEGKPVVQKETYLIRKTLIPVRKDVKERRKWEKFGEVKGVKRGEHLPGDYARESEVTILTSTDEAGEIGIVAQLEGITTEGMRERQLERKKKEMAEITSSFDDKPKPAKSKLEAAFGGAAPAQNDFSVKVWDIYANEKDIRKAEMELNEFFNPIWDKIGVRCVRAKYLSNRSTGEFIGKAYFTFPDDKSCAKALAAVERLDYNSVSLSAEWAKDDKKPPRRR
jgi:hypothetical protein